MFRLFAFCLLFLLISIVCVQADAVVGTVAIGGAWPSQVIIDSTSNTVYVLSYGSGYNQGTISAINGANFNYLGGIDSAGEAPYAIALNPNSKIYITTGDSVRVFTESTFNSNKWTSVNSGGYAWGVAVNPATNVVYTVNNDKNTVGVLGSTTVLINVGIDPYAIAVNSVTNKIYVVNRGFPSYKGTVTVINANNNNSTTTVNVGLKPQAIAVNSVTNKIYVLNDSSNTVTIIDGVTDSTSTINVGKQGALGIGFPQSSRIVVNPVTNNIYVSNDGSNTVTVINGLDGSTATVAVGNNPYAIAVNSATNKIYVANNSSNTVTIINGANNSTTTLPTGASPVAIAANSVTNTIYVANNGGNSVTIIGDTATPILTSPTNGSINQPTTLTMSWGSFMGATMYKILVSTSTANGWTGAISNQTVTTPWASVSNLANNTLYYWEVNATYTNATSKWSSIWSFTTTSPAPGKPILSLPASGSVGLSSVLTLSWGTVSTANSYGVQVSTSSSFGTTVSNQSGLTILSASEGGLNNATVYYWRVDAANVGGISVWSSIWSFATIISTPLLSSPANGAQNQSTAPTLSWGTVSGATSYSVQISSTAVFSSTIVNQGGITTVSSKISGLALSGGYFWRVNATNTAGTSAWSSIWSFTTVSTAVLPQNDLAIAKRFSISNSGIAYELSASSRVSITLYDIQGRQVRQILNTTQNAGSYNIDLRREKITAGFYVVKFKAGTFIVHKRLSLMN